ncbi:3-hydroxy-fatty acyl-ACP dehydratase [Aestuariirhabdus sp. Z084]|uniref:ApeP family dehydratase n=1 Tax=Aestuariirhabdus haliotis TaxID=2918751 RepID=UPI00201B3C84|nr:3-hydroxy-fatty acyl-ACP dehydratase [Aestuariirhabdus haliotis]MCL6414059.1 3-hydroxy-fatty acyl-ACP dehydratase [Aestuariirhabdus haliotis]MCL6417992.1 3-hydroxy-fatty acyl-ACP dehydratase [Aestuariirhabdus haliotis]
MNPDLFPVNDCLIHQPPMRMVERLLAIDEANVRCSLVLHDDNPFITEQGQLPASLGIELMAQAIALFGGYHCLNRGEEVRVGYLIGSRRYHSTRPFFALGCELIIEAHQEYLSEGMGLFNCRILERGNEIANGRLNTYLPDAQAELFSP